MPTYEYECTDCEHKFEQFQKMTDKGHKMSLKCKGKVKRLDRIGRWYYIQRTGVLYHRIQK